MRTCKRPAWWMITSKAALNIGNKENNEGWRRMGPGRSRRAYSRVRGAATAKGSEHVRVMRRQDPRLNSYTGHDSSFHAISQNIHSYRELMMNACSIRAFSPSLACFAHISTFPRIHLP